MEWAEEIRNMKSKDEEGTRKLTPLGGIPSALVNAKGCGSSSPSSCFAETGKVLVPFLSSPGWTQLLKGVFLYPLPWILGQDKTDGAQALTKYKERGVFQRRNGEGGKVS